MIPSRVRLLSALLSALPLGASLVRPAALAAQGAELRGVVRDSATGAPVAGAVVMVLDSRGTVVHRSIASERGQYRVIRPAGATQLRALRLGFRPTTVSLGSAAPTPASGTPPEAQAPTLDLLLSSIPRALDVVGVTAARGCPVRSDRAEAFDLLDQARAGLLAAVVAREQSTATMRVLRYERLLDLDGVEIEHQTVRIESATRATRSFNAAQGVPDLVETGFRTGAAGDYTYFGPDADVLLDTRFQNGYCFTLAEADSTRVGQRGLHFSPASRRSGRVDIDGTLWIDTAQRTLRDLTFAYVGVEPLAAAFGAGGQVGFHTTSSGLAFIARWSLRLVGPPDVVVGQARSTSQQYAIREIGGEVAEAHFTDGSAFRSTLSTAVITAVYRDGSPARFSNLRFAESNYATTTDSLGRATIPSVLPGRYHVVARDPRLDLIDVDVPTGRTVTIPPGATTLVRVTVPTAEQYVASLCGADTLLSNDTWLLARVVGSAGEPVGNVRYQLHERNGEEWRAVSVRGVTTSSGLVPFCRDLALHSEVELTAWHDAHAPIRVRQRLSRKVSVLRLEVPTNLVTAQSGPGDPLVMTVRGVVTDSVRGMTVANARITFLDTPLEGASDANGEFLIGGVPRGVHRVEVSTPWHDSIGAVARTTVVVGNDAPLSLHVPVIGEVLRLSCGPSGQTGAIVGRVDLGDATAESAQVRVVAQWRDGNNTPRVAESPVESSGTYRLCGLPIGTPLEVHAAVQGNALPGRGARIDDVHLSEERPLQRIDLAVDFPLARPPLVTVR